MLDTNTNKQTAMNHYRSRLVCRVLKAHAKGEKTHGKDFAVCNTRQSAHGIQLSAKRSFAMGLLSGTRQRGCRVHFLIPGKKIIANKKKKSSPAVQASPAAAAAVQARPGHAGRPSELAPLPPLARPSLLV